MRTTLALQWDDHPATTMKTIARFSQLEQAQMAKMKLGAAGIDAFIPDEMSAGTIPYLFTTKTGIRLQVSEEDESEALEILDLGDSVK